jgi:hypothetical protein
MREANNRFFLIAATAMSNATFSTTIPITTKYTAAMPLMSTAQKFFMPFAACKSSGRKIAIAASIRIPMPAPK